jgi:hypothetical protein
MDRWICILLTEKVTLRNARRAPTAVDRQSSFCELSLGKTGLDNRQLAK